MFRDLDNETIQQIINISSVYPTIKTTSNLQVVKKC